MKQYEVLNKMITGKLAVVVRGSNAEEAEKSSLACIEGGVKTIEVTFTVPGANRVIEKLAGQYDDVVVGAGTVLDSETARIAIMAGAEFIVSPAFDPETAKLCNRYSIPYLPGTMTINEMLTALEHGVAIVKLFPGQTFEPSFIKNVKGPLPNINIMPTGGINLDNVEEWLEAGAVMVGVGGEITRPAKHGDYEEVARLAKNFQIKVQGG